MLCDLALSPLFAPLTTFGNVDDVVIGPLCHILQKAPSGENWCNREFNPFEFLLKTVKNELQPKGDFPIEEQPKRRRNFASGGGGANIISELTSVAYGRTPCTGSSEPEILTCNVMRNGHLKPYTVVLEDNIGEGECYEFAGGIGQLAIKFTEPVTISHISIDHPPLEILSPQSRLRMPQNMSLWVLVDKSDDANYIQGQEDNMPTIPVEMFRIRPSPSAASLAQQHPTVPLLEDKSLLTRIAAFQYEVSNSSSARTRQTFFTNPARKIRSQFGILMIDSNWGGETTCFYWIGVYGET